MRYADDRETSTRRRTSSEAAFRPRPRRPRNRGWRGVNRWGTETGDPCGVCGETAPVYRVEAPEGVCLGCERCLDIYRYGVVQL
ncbi:MAG: hypothetical protein IJT94_13430 [Oscillibacter sp.]|nr:hypothetical protein [Oscillibacter sp.]